jgi:hypothetical protein
MASFEKPEKTSGRLIATSMVKGTSVYDLAGTKLGNIYDIMLDKISGKADYAIMSFGGFLGLGESYHPLPWNQLKYDTILDGYVVNLDRNRLEGAPQYAAEELPQWDEQRRNDIDSYYGGGVLYEPSGVTGAGLGSRDRLNM